MKFLQGLILLGLSSLSHAFTWTDLWLTRDQQAQKLMATKNYKEAEERFQATGWKAAAAYRAKDYQKASELYTALGTDQGFYNAGNALAHAQAFPKALQAYEKALRINPHNKLALDNKKLIEDLLKNQPPRPKKPSSGEEKNQQQKDQSQGMKNASDNQGKKRQNSKTPNTDNKAQDNKTQDNKAQDNKAQDKTKPGQDASASGEKAMQLPQENSQKKDKAGKSQSLAEKEKQEANDKLLRILPEDPGGLLREKFLRDYQRRHDE